MPNSPFNWEIFWSAASAIGTIFVGLVAIGITIWQTHLQYRTKLNVKVHSAIIPYEEGCFYSIVITNNGNTDVNILRIVCKKFDGKNSYFFLTNKLKTTPLPLPCVIKPKQVITLCIPRKDDSKFTLKGRISVEDSLNKSHRSNKIKMEIEAPIL